MIMLGFFPTQHNHVILILTWTFTDYILLSHAVCIFGILLNMEFYIQNVTLPSKYTFNFVFPHINFTVG